MPTVSLHTSQAMVSAIAKAALAAGSTSRRSGGAMLDRQIQLHSSLSPLAAAIGRLDLETKKLGRRRSCLKNVLKILAADGDEHDLRWRGLKDALADVGVAVATATHAIAGETTQEAARLAELHARAAAAVARVRGSGMVEGKLTDAQLKLARAALNTGALTYPFELFPLVQSNPEPTS